MQLITFCNVIWSAAKIPLYLRPYSVMVTGAQSDQCIRCTLHGAFTRGYDATLVGDAHTTVDLSSHGTPPPEQVIAHTNLYWKYHEAPGRAGAVVEADKIEFQRGSME